jgi:hypothetical protein
MAPFAVFAKACKVGEELKSLQSSGRLNTPEKTPSYFSKVLVLAEML